MKEWATRKSRADGQVTRNIEASRFASVLGRREYRGALAAEDNSEVAVPTFDVSRPTSAVQGNGLRDTELDSVDGFRMLHSHLLHTAPTGDDRPLSSNTAQSSWIMLSPYLQRPTEPDGGEPGDLGWTNGFEKHDDEQLDFMHLRSQQLEEAHRAKLALGHAGVACNAQVLENALVMPIPRPKKPCTISHLRDADGNKFDGIGAPAPFLFHVAVDASGKVLRHPNGDVIPSYEAAPPLPRLIVNPCFDPEAYGKKKAGKKKRGKKK
mmetsp:Transcript_38347/g.86122  ORF Transcript_38347/g.86122 Transcript_38347/m.86122 type:complete len:266 (-) Transcript_38347:57-854(-)